MRYNMLKNCTLVAVMATVTTCATRTAFGSGACLRVSTLTGTPTCVVVADEATCTSVPNSVYFGDGTTCADVPEVYYHPGGGQINISGATLFANFFEFPAATNDVINVDGDIIPCNGQPFVGFANLDCDPMNSPDGIDQLAPGFTCGQKWHGHWIVQYRSVGSGNGLAEFVDYQLAGILPSRIPTELGVLNARRWAGPGIKQGPLSGCEANCFPPLNSADMDCNGIIDGADLRGFIDAMLSGVGCDINRADLNDDFIIDLLDLPRFVSCVLDGGLNCGRAINVSNPPNSADTNESGSPICPTSVDIANMDVPTKWFVLAPGGSGSWNRKPTFAGYGDNPNGSSDTGFSNKLKPLSRSNKSGQLVTLNVDTANPDSNTVFDTTIAYSPVVPIANRGTGLENVTFSELQYAFVTGRMPNGENLIVNCRDVGSGTRNAWSNSIGIDPSWASGDNIGNQTTSSSNTNLGPNTRATQCGSSSHSENAAQQRRLCLGYTGIFGADRAAADAIGGLYEILNVRKDVAGGTQYVRCDVDSVLDNSDVNTGWQIGGSQTLATRGDYRSGIDGNTNPPMNNPAARDYMMNLTVSISNYVNSGAAPEFNSPAEILVKQFILDVGVDATPELTDPMNYLPTTGFDQAIQDDVRAINVTTVPAFGSVFPGDGGRVPVRNNNPGLYSDGSTAAYLDGNGAPTITSGQRVFPRMKIQGDFEADGDRDIDDIAPMLAALSNPRAFSAADAANHPGNYIIPEILGDFDGDGNFNHMDIRYFADGLALVNGSVNRKAGFIEVDEAWEAATAAGNFFFTDTTKVPTTTVLITGTYDAGDARGDVAGNTPWRGAQPHGHDFVVNHADIEYVRANIYAGVWGTNLDNHFDKDLSCDMNGDLLVDCADVVEIVEKILDTKMGDLDLNGVVDCGDITTLQGNIGVVTSGATYAQGDLDCDGDVDADDLAIACGNCPGCAGTCCP
ncbi:MAG: hypothetical protein KF841_16910 [Phycisphaerae bacterium]|nr:hypothetical protein [Phycisphaerae bacterium]